MWKGVGQSTCFLSGQLLADINLWSSLLTGVLQAGEPLRYRLPHRHMYRISLSVYRRHFGWDTLTANWNHSSYRHGLLHTDIDDRIPLWASSCSSQQCSLLSVRRLIVRSKTSLELLAICSLWSECLHPFDRLFSQALDWLLFVVTTNIGCLSEEVNIWAPRP